LVTEERVLIAVGMAGSWHESIASTCSDARQLMSGGRRVQMPPTRRRDVSWRRAVHSWVWKPEGGKYASLRQQGKNWVGQDDQA
jgi:hypothetical protein